MSLSKFVVWASSNDCAEMEPCVPKQHDSLALTDGYRHQKWPNGENVEIGPSYLCRDYERFEPESWLQASFHS